MGFINQLITGTILCYVWLEAFRRICIGIIWLSESVTHLMSLLANHGKPMMWQFLIL